MFRENLDKRPQKKASSSKHISLGIPRRPLLSLSLSIVLCRRYKIAFRFYSYKKEKKQRERERSNEKKIDWLRDSWRNCTCQYWLPPSISLSLTRAHITSIRVTHSIPSLSLRRSWWRWLRVEETKLNLSHTLFGKKAKTDQIVWFDFGFIPPNPGNGAAPTLLLLSNVTKAR